jgi:hypothetical protein
MFVNRYYSDELTNDTEGNLVMLCRCCARNHKGQVRLVGNGDEGSTCELCDATNDLRTAVGRLLNGSGD